MSKGSKKMRTKNGRRLDQQNAKTDFTLYDFAHADPTGVHSGRMKKGDMKKLTTEVKQLCGKSGKSTAELAWYEKDLSDFDSSDEEPVCLEEPDQPEKLHRNQRKSSDMPTEVHGVLYPLDLWCILSEYIDPEDVVTFAGICRGAHRITHSAKFWYSLYKRNFRKTDGIPMTLRPDAMERLHGLRSRVICALYHVHPPFQKRMRGAVPFENDPDSLHGAQCTLMWYQKVKSLWYFYLKFARINQRGCPLAATTGSSCAPASPSGNKSQRKDYLLSDANIHYNAEENSVALQIVGHNFFSLPPSVMGQYLAKSAVSVGHGMRYHKVKLLFTPQPYLLPSSDKNALALSATPVVMDPVLNMHVLHWWDPRYPVAVK